MNWEIVSTILASFGGLELVKFLVNRKAHTRKENASAKEAEVNVHEKQIERYEQRLTARDAKVDAIYAELRAEQKKNLALLEELNRVKLTNELLNFQKCEVRGCSGRVPPGIY